MPAFLSSHLLSALTLLTTALFFNLEAKCYRNALRAARSSSVRNCKWNARHPGLSPTPGLFDQCHRCDKRAHVEEVEKIEKGYRFEKEYRDRIARALGLPDGIFDELSDIAAAALY